MKKILMLMIGLGLVLSTNATFAQQPPPKDDKKEDGKKDDKKGPKKDDKKDEKKGQNL